MIALARAGTPPARANRRDFASDPPRAIAFRVGDAARERARSRRAIPRRRTRARAPSREHVAFPNRPSVADDNCFFPPFAIAPRASGPRGSRAAARRGSERAADTRVSELRRLIARGVHDPVRRMRPRVRRRPRSASRAIVREPSWISTPSIDGSRVSVHRPVARAAPRRRIPRPRLLSVAERFISLSTVFFSFSPLPLLSFFCPPLPLTAASLSLLPSLSVRFPQVPHVLPLPADGGAPARGLVLPQLRRRRERRVRLWVQLREDVHDGRFRKVVPGLRRGVLRRGGRPREDVHRRPSRKRSGRWSRKAANGASTCTTAATSTCPPTAAGSRAASRRAPRAALIRGRTT